MPIISTEEKVRTGGHDDCLDITDAVQQAVTRSKLKQGLATVFVTGSTAGVTTTEFEPGLVQDVQEAVRRLFPESLRYAHHEAAGDENGFSHLWAAFIGPSLSIPFIGGKLQLGTWQQIVLLDFDVRPRTRQYVIQLLGE